MQVKDNNAQASNTNVVSRPISKLSNFIKEMQEKLADDEEQK